MGAKFATDKNSIIWNRGHLVLNLVSVLTCLWKVFEKNGGSLLLEFTSELCNYYFDLQSFHTRPTFCSISIRVRISSSILNFRGSIDPDWFLIWRKQPKVQANLCTTTTLGTLNLWPLLTGGRCSEVALCYENWKWDSKMVVAVGRWSLAQV